MELLPLVKWYMSRADFNYVKRLILSAPETHAKRRVLKRLWEVQEDYFLDRARAQRELIRKRRDEMGEQWTLQEAHTLIRNALKYILRHTKAYWYDRPAQDAVIRLAKISKELREEVRAQREDTGDRNGIGEHLPCDRGGEVMDESPAR